MFRSAIPMPANRRTTSGDIAAPPVIATLTRLRPSWSRSPRSTLHSATTLASRAIGVDSRPSMRARFTFVPAARAQSTHFRRSHPASIMRLNTPEARFSHWRGPSTITSTASSRIASCTWSGRSAKLTRIGSDMPSVTPNHCSGTHESGMYDRYSLWGRISSARRNRSAQSSSARCVVTTPLGWPVVPEV